MSAQYFTPGPWYLERNKIRRKKYESGHSYTLCAYGPVYFGIAKIEGPSNDTPEDIAALHANARLIAQAPAMLGALASVHARLNAILSSEDIDRQAICEALDELNNEVWAAMHAATGLAQP